MALHQLELKIKISNDAMEKISPNFRKKIKEQIQSQKVGFLLGAGSSYLNGEGYPLATQLWERISSDVPLQERQDIQTKIDAGATGIENALDLLDTGQVEEGPHRHSVVAAIAAHFSNINGPLHYHRLFVEFLSQKASGKPTSIFSLNYDPLIEQASEMACIRLFDGFHGHESAFFDAGSFQHVLTINDRSYRRNTARLVDGSIRLIKLHGSLGWYDDSKLGVRRAGFSRPLPETAKHLMIPPQYRKASDTVRPPYSTLWEQFRNSLFHGANKLNRLVTIGYGMADEHVNVVIESALQRSDFTLIIITKELSDNIFDKWASKDKVHIITEKRCASSGELSGGNPSLCTFEGLIEEMSKW